MTTSERTMLLGGWGDTGLTRDQVVGMKEWESDPILVRSLERVQAIVARLKQAEQDLTLEIAARLREREGSVMVDNANGLQAVLESSKSWVCNLETLAEIQGYITPHEWDQLAPLPPDPGRKPNKTVGNQLAKRGGPIARIIADAWTEVPGEPRVKVKSLK